MQAESDTEFYWQDLVVMLDGIAGAVSLERIDALSREVATAIATRAAAADSAAMQAVLTRAIETASESLKRHDRAVEALNERSRIAQRASGVGSFYWYPDTDAIDGTEQFRTLWGFPADVAISSAMMVDRIHRDDRDQTYQCRNVEYRIRRADTDEERWLARRGQMVTDENGSRFVGVVLDVTEQRQAEAARIESEGRFRLIADSAPVPMWVSAPGGTRTFVNRTYCAYLGLSFEETLAFDWRDGLHPEDRERVIAEQAAGEASGKSFEVETRYLRADGEWRWLRTRSRPRFGADGGHRGFVGVAYDVTDVRRAEQELRGLNDRLEERVEAALAAQAETEAALRQAQKMEAVGRLTGGIAHDFNNLLTPVIGGLELIAGRLDEARLRRLADNALEAARRGAKLTGQLLAFSRVQRLSIVPVDVPRLIEHMSDLIRSAIGPQIPIRFEVDEDTGAATCDLHQLENAILNLAINARDAMAGMERDALLTVSTGRITSAGSAEYAPGDYVMVTVSDTGTGMTEEVRARAGEPFFTTKAFGSGTGLGLAQVHGVAKQCGGAMQIESRVGVGTAVSILLPVARIETVTETGPSAGPDPALIGKARANARILVVDDDDDVRTFLVETLAAAGYHVGEAKEGKGALEMIERFAPDLLLIDYAMPGMTGAEAAASARARWPTLPIIIATGYVDSEVVRGALGDDVVLLAKPFDFATLERVIVETLRIEGNGREDAA